MKRMIFKMFAVAIIVIGFSAYMGFSRTGISPWEALKRGTPDMSNIGLPKAVPDVVDKVVPAEKTVVYKWRDAAGGWHYSNEQPPDGVGYELLNVDPNTNLMAGVKVPSEEPEMEEEGGLRQPKFARSGAKEEESAEDPMLYSPEGVQKLMEDAQNVQKMLNDRAKAQKEMLNQL